MSGILIGFDMAMASDETSLSVYVRDSLVDRITPSLRQCMQELVDETGIPMHLVVGEEKTDVAWIFPSDQDA